MDVKPEILGPIQLRKTPDLLPSNIAPITAYIILSLLNMEVHSSKWPDPKPAIEIFILSLELLFSKEGAEEVEEEEGSVFLSEEEDVFLGELREEEEDFSTSSYVNATQEYEP